MKQLNIRKTTFSINAAAVILYSVLAFTPASVICQNLVTNGGFSSGSTGWSTGCSIEINPETAYGGTNGSNAATEIDAERCFNQNICILPGLTYNFSFKASRRTQSGTPTAPGITFSVTGLTTAANYVNITKTYSNTVFNLQTETYSFTIPAEAADNKVNISFTNYNNTATYGVILDDIQLAPISSDSLSIDGADILSPGEASSWALNNAPGSIASYNWNFGATANQPVSVLAAPAGIQWSAIGAGNVSVILSNGTCTVATLSKPLYIINQLLAVQFVSFTGAVNGNKNLLNWVTENEENNKYFIVERSSNGNGFDSIGVVAPAGNGTTHNYSFTDGGFKTGSNYYRLRQVDKNGDYKNSAIVIISNYSSAKETLQLFPNPAAAVLNFQLNSSHTSTSTIQVFNASGNIMINKKQALTTGSNQHALDISSLASGIYFIKITDDANSIQFVQQFSKIK